MNTTSTYRLFPLVWALSLSLSLTACGPEDPPSTNNGEDVGPDVDAADADTDAGADGTCETEEDCTGDYAGQVCIGGTCDPCERGSDACVCLSNGECDALLECDADTNLCAPCTPGDEGCSCSLTAEACQDGLSCDEGLCVAESCTDGALDCPCDVGACDDADAYCDGSDICQTCTNEIEGCACDSGECVGDELYCDDSDDTCTTCPDVDKPAGCGCDANNECDLGLTCDETEGACREKAVCADVCGDPFGVCDESGSGDPVCMVMVCVDGYGYDETTMSCQPLGRTSCDGDDGIQDISQTCADANKDCVELTDDSATCVDTCDLLDCASSNQECEAGDPLGTTAAEISAACTDCVTGYVDDGAGACVVDTSLNCSAFDAASILQDCDDKNRECDSLVGGGAECGACLSGFEYDAATDSCVETSLCNGVACEAGEYCSYPEIGGDPFCAAEPCAPGEAADDTGACVTCAISCDADGVYPVQIDGACECASDVFCKYQPDDDGDRCITRTCADGEAVTPGGTCTTCNKACGSLEGERARVWPETTVDGACFCETQEGYATPFGGSGAPIGCDKDGDGWINETSDLTYNTAVSASDGAVIANFRCARRQIDRVTLVNEWGQRRHVSLCGQDLVDYSPSAAITDVCSDPDGFTELTLLEDDVLDDDAKIQAGTAAADFPAYANGTGGRVISAAEVNAFTKGCVTATNDFNQNGAEDASEEQALTKSRLNGVTYSTDEAFMFRSMSYFIEMHSGQYVANTVQLGEAGSYEISERSRCDADFPIGYGNASTYGAQCSRLRRGDYDYNDSHVGYDFAHFSCSDNDTGSCGMFDPPTDLQQDDEDGDRIADHGLCDLTGTLDDEPWRGMTHHSQYQCVVLKAASTDNSELAIDQVHSVAAPTVYEFNRCSATDCSGGAAGCAETTSQGGFQPEISNIECTAVDRNLDNVVQDEVGFVAIRYSALGPLLDPTYVRGCIDESRGTTGGDGWEELCPGYENNPDSILAAGNPGAFGKLICACNLYYGGSNCEVACKQRGTALDSAGNAVVPDVSTSFVHVGADDFGYNKGATADVTLIEQYACDADNGFCMLHEATYDANSDVIFEGGRRGYWMCGDTELTLGLIDTVDAGGNTVQVTTPTLDGSGVVDGVTKSYVLDGEVKLVPIQRELLEQDATTCTTGNCWSVF